MLKRFWPMLALLALTLIFFHKLAFTDLILARGDTFAYFYPYWAVRNAALLQGQLPLWTPNLFMGAPLLANSQLGTFYPPNWLVLGLMPPDGIRVSILMHIFWMLLGTYALAHEVTGSRLSALAAAVVFGLGGYAGAHVEQINQLQGIAWMPWLFLFYIRAMERSRRDILLLGAGLALQFLSGHTQTVFITGVGLGIYGLTHSLTQPQRWWQVAIAVVVLALAGLIALPLIVPQLIPTLELTDVSNRSGGLNPNQATAFSFNPLVMGRGLLPSYDSLVFGEYVAYGGVIGFGLAIIGALAANRKRWVWLVMVGIAFALALGEFNPLYWLLAALPGFNWFRVPARWLALFALGVAMLVGLGVQRLVEIAQRPSRRTLALIGIVIVALAVSSTFITQTPEDVIGSAAPTAITWAGWAIAFMVLMGLMIARGVKAYFVVLALVIELFFASLVMPFNILSTPDTYASQRFTISQMRAYGAEQTPPGRVLSITNLLFDPGDRATLEARYRRYGLSDLSVRLGLVDTKMKESLGANLPLIWDIPSVDGFDGGVLPTAYYTAFTSLMLPTGELRTLDGRLREILAKEACRGACIPDQRWLNLTNTRYLLTDKIYDVWHEGVAYDTQFTQANSTDLAFEAFEADTVDVLCENCACPEISVNDLRLEAETPTQAGDYTRCRLRLDEAQNLNQLEIDAPNVHAVTLVDSRTGDFVQLVPNPNWQRVLSSDIKLYENQSVLPRAFVVHEALVVADDIYGTEDALDQMRAEDFDPAEKVILSSNESSLGTSHDSLLQATAAITSYSAEHVEITVEAATEGYLLLTDAYYPGWVATVNDQATEITRADVMFRAVPVPAGASTVVFSYQPAWLPGVLIVGIVAWVVWLIALMGLRKPT